MTHEHEELANIKAKLREAESALKTAIAAVSFANVKLGLLESFIERTNPTSDLALAVKAVEKQLRVVKPEPIQVVEEPLTINEEWERILDLLGNGSSHIFVTGEAGTGKSTLLSHFQKICNRVIAVLAPTGVAALRVGGETIHRFFGFPAAAIQKDDIREVNDSRRAKYKAVDILIIDEISMVRADLMDAIDMFMRKNGRNKDLPFGGARLVMFGDLFQLPPVSKEKDEKRYLADRYGTETPYFFHAEVWRNANLLTCALTTIFRQKDSKFTDALNAVRSGMITPEYMMLLNSRVNPSFRPPTDGDLWLTLTTTNASADQQNQRMLSSLKTPLEEFESIVQGDFDMRNAPTDEILQLKAGAVVMFIRNSKAGGWSNGTLGKVISTNPLKVEINGGDEVEVDPETWEAITYQWDEHEKKLTKSVKGKFTQIPLKLASAITIHKAQGLTFDQVIVDFSSGAFAAGQAYVALSRCRTLEGMVLRRAVQERDLIVSTEVQRFMKGEAIARPAGQLSLI